MSTKEPSATSADEQPGHANALASITAMQQGLFGACFAQAAIETCLVISGMTRQPWNVQRIISAPRRLFRR